jgi:hypothetical protein
VAQTTFLFRHKGGALLTKTVEVDANRPDGNQPYQFKVREDVTKKMYHHVTNQVGTGEWIYEE